MPGLYRTEVWQAYLPDPWQAREDDGQASVTMFRPGGVGMLEIVATDDTRSTWRDQGAEFRGALLGLTGTLVYGERFSRWWTLLCGSATLYVSYRCPAQLSELERAEIDAILQTLSQAPNNAVEATADPRGS